MSEPTKQYPVTFKGQVIGQCDQDFNNLQLDNTQEAKDFIENHLHGKTNMYVSSRSLGKIDNNNQLYDVQLQNFNIGLK